MRTPALPFQIEQAGVRYRNITRDFQNFNQYTFKNAHLMIGLLFL